MPPDSPTHNWRIGRGILAAVSLFMLAAWTLVALTVGICGLSLQLERLRDARMLCLLRAYPVPLAALPPFSQRLRGRPWRWALVPSLLAVAGLTYAMVSELDTRAPGSLTVLLLVLPPLLACSVYVVLRVLRPGAT